MSYSIILTSSEVITLGKLRRTEKDGKILRRHQCIWMANENFPKKEIASTLGVNIDTVTDWIKIFSKDRVMGLRTLHYASRRLSRLDFIKDLLKQHLDSINKCNLFLLENKAESERFLPEGKKPSDCAG